MNGKKAKQLRKLVKQHVSHLPELVMEEMNQRPKVYRDDVSGYRFNYSTSTNVMGDCFRKFYQMAKKAHYQYNKS